MTTASQLFGLPALTLSALAEAFFIYQLWSKEINQHSYLHTVGAALLANYSFGIVFWGFLYPRFFSPLKHLAGPRVGVYMDIIRL